MYNCNKFKKFMDEKNLGKKDFAEQLSVNPARIDELSRGKEIKPLLDRISNLFNIDIETFYGGYEEPEYMIEVRKKINEGLSMGLTFAEIAALCTVNRNVVRDIMNHSTFSCSNNIANKIIHANLKNTTN